MYPISPIRAKVLSVFPPGLGLGTVSLGNPVRFPLLSALFTPESKTHQIPGNSFSNSNPAVAGIPTDTPQGRCLLSTRDGMNVSVLGPHWRNYMKNHGQGKEKTTNFLDSSFLFSAKDGKSNPPAMKVCRNY
jgi:hypothetical protein